MLIIFFLQYKNELENDEEIFIEKSKELNRLKDQIKEIEREKQELEKSIRNFMNSSRQKDKQLFEQQLRIQTFEDQVVEQISKSEKKGKSFVVLFDFIRLLLDISLLSKEL